MALPTQQNVRIDPLVRNILIAKSNEEKNYIADLILPPIPVTEVSGVIPTIGNSHLRSYDSKRATYDESQHRIEFTTSTSVSYKIDWYDLEVFIPDELVAAEQVPFDVQVAGGWTVTQAMMLEKDRSLAAIMTSTSAITQNVTLSGTSQFNDVVNSRPDQVIELARTTIFNKSGREANSMALSRKAFNTLKYHPFFTNQMRGLAYTGDAELLGLLKLNFEVDNVFIGKTISVTSNEGQTATMDTVWGNDIVLFYRPATPMLYEPAFGYTFQLVGGELEPSLRRHHNDIGFLTRVRMARQQKIIDTDMAYLIKNAVA